MNRQQPAALRDYQQRVQAARRRVAAARREKLLELERRSEAYPKLVAALRAFIGAGEYNSSNSEQAIAALRACGELGKVAVPQPSRTDGTK